MRDENTFATAYRSDLRDEIVETLKDYADGITPTKQWCWGQYDDVELPVTGNAIMVPGRATLARVPRICRTSCSQMIGVGLSLAITRTTRPLIILKNLRFSTALGFSPKSLIMRFPNCLRSEGGMFAYDNLVQWCKDMRSAQIARRNRAWNFQHAHGIDPCDVAWNADAIRWVDGVVYVVSRNVKRNGELGERYTVLTAEQWLDMHRVPGDESCVARLESYCESEA